MPQRLFSSSLTTALALSLSIAIAPPASAEVPAKEKALLQKVQATYGNLRSYRMSGKLAIDITVKGESQSMEARLLMAGAKPLRLRDEIGHDKLGQITASNGEETWLYKAGIAQHMRQEDPTPSPLDSSGATGPGLSAGFFAMARNLLTDANAARTLRTEPLTVNGKSVRCTVVEVDYAYLNRPATTRTYWIDASNRIVRHRTVVTISGSDGTTSQTETVTLAEVALDRPLPDSVFAFTPPIGSMEVVQFRAPGTETVDLSGQMAEDFTLTDLAGNSHQLSAQKGKVVLLDFWATWCGPCRIQMPNVEKLHKEFKDKGLVVYAVNQRESPEAAKRYITRNNYTTTTLLDRDGAVGDRYHVMGIPSLIVIDREGKIAAHFVGVRGEGDLRAALKKAGME